MVIFTRSRHALAFAPLALTLLSSAAHATNGYFANGFGGVSVATAGAGLTQGIEPSDLANNPALGVDVGTQVEGCVSLFAPIRTATIGPGSPVLTPGSFQSKSNLFPIPCLGGNLKLNDRLAVGLILYGNGGLDVDYKTPLFGPELGKLYGFPVSNTFADLEQVFISANIAYKVTDNFTIGIAPTLAVQRFDATGLQIFAADSASPGNLTNNGYEFSYGGGIKVGALWKPTPWLSAAFAYQSPTYMTSFSKYSGLFAGGGAFDIPQTLSAGFGVKLSPTLTVLPEYERIFFGSIPAIADSGVPPFAAPLGGHGGPGFGWQDVNIFRLGAVWQALPQLTLRGGFSYATQTISSESQLMFNILAPATPTTHIAAGATYNFARGWSATLSYQHAFDKSLSGNAPAAFGAQPIRLDMYQNEVGFDIAYKF